MLKNVATVLLEGVHPFELGVIGEVFGLDRSDDGMPVYDFAVVSATHRTLATHAGYSITTHHGLERLDAADLIAVPTGATIRRATIPKTSWRLCAGPWTGAPGC